VPYGHSVDNLLDVEESMAYRRAEVQKLLKTGEAIVSLTHFPHMGVGDFAEPPCVPGGPIARSLFVPDEIINPHPRFATLTKNIRERRGRKIDINIPIFMDSLTRFVCCLFISYDFFCFCCCRCPSGESERHLPGCVYLDAMAFGMGSSCVQCKILL
jgi:glutamate--cysteine ligase catalytic subunit